MQRSGAPRRDPRFSTKLKWAARYTCVPCGMSVSAPLFWGKR